ncbi:GMC family oxidoreductase [Salinibacterium sp. M195]|uniref:GMC family oxidoreductase n=1 Tax=Salinibacterium sp. M195 TaxID=2583374 RepID=UPI001C629D0C|nr:GMC family oxidoreductase [Salinibacterium sp. M195]QYH35090.1 GMC family oxidoreductase [Salinibacterium sp. M195]
MRRVIVVGAGTAGCIVAARLSEDASTSVLLLDSGPDREPGAQLSGLRSLNWIDALGETAAFYPDLFASKLEGSEPKLYNRGTGVGGSGAVNAMLALPGLPEDYDRWARDFGCDQWSWEQVQPWLEELKSDLIVSTEEEFTPVDRALLDAAERLDLPTGVDTYGPQDGSGLLWRNANASGRFSSLERYLNEARSRDNLVIQGNSQTDRLLIEGDVVVGVVLADGTELRADDVVLCAGVFETPAILLRSHLTHPAIGKNLQDHPAASVYFTLKPEFREVNTTGPCIGAVMRLSSSFGAGDIHLLPLHGTLLNGTEADHGLIMAALMKVTSSGELELNPENPLAPPIVRERMLSTEQDRAAMKEAIVYLEQVIAAPSFQRIIERVFIDEHGTPLSALHDDEFFESWVRSYVGDYFHACGTVRMGEAGDPNAVVDQQGRLYGLANIRVIDASIMPDVPSANTHLPTALIAERLSAAMRATSAAPTPAPQDA